MNTANILGKDSQRSHGSRAVKYGHRRYGKDSGEDRLNRQSKLEVDTQRESTEAQVANQVPVTLVVVQVAVIEQDIAPVKGVAHPSQPLPGKGGRPTPDIRVEIREPATLSQAVVPPCTDDAGLYVFRALRFSGF